MTEYKDWKIFNGEKYTFLYHRHSKSEAQQEAKEERGKGWKIRIVKMKIGTKTYYDLYGKKSPYWT